MILGCYYNAIINNFNFSVIYFWYAMWLLHFVYDYECLSEWGSIKWIKFLSAKLTILHKQAVAC